MLFKKSMSVTNANESVREAGSRAALMDPGPLRRFGFWPGLLCRQFFAHVRSDPGAIEHIRAPRAR